MGFVECFRWHHFSSQMLIYYFFFVFDERCSTGYHLSLTVPFPLTCPQISAPSRTWPWPGTARRSAVNWATRMLAGCRGIPRQYAARPGTPRNSPPSCLTRREGAWDAWQTGAPGWAARTTGHGSRPPAVPIPTVVTTPIRTAPWRRCPWVWPLNSHPRLHLTTPQSEKSTCEEPIPHSSVQMKRRCTHFKSGKGLFVRWSQWPFFRGRDSFNYWHEHLLLSFLT